MAEKLITSYSLVEELLDDDVLLVDGENGTRTIAANDAANYFYNEGLDGYDIVKKDEDIAGLTSSVLDYTTDIYAGKHLEGDFLHVEDMADSALFKSLMVSFSAKQDFHGYNYAWRGGGGDNIFPTIRQRNYHVNDITASSTSDGYITISGDPCLTGDTTFAILLSTSFKIPTGSREYYLHMLNTSAEAFVVKLGTFTYQFSNENAIIRIPGSVYGTSISQLIIKIPKGNSPACRLRPMITSSNTSQTWSPYSNICLINGRAKTTLYRAKKNLHPTISPVSVQRSSTETIYLTSDYIYLPSGTYTFSWLQDVDIASCANNQPECVREQDGRIFRCPKSSMFSGRGGWTFTLSESDNYKFRWNYGAVSNECVISDFMLELGGNLLQNSSDVVINDYFDETTMVGIADDFELTPGTYVFSWEQDKTVTTNEADPKNGMYPAFVRVDDDWMLRVVDRDERFLNKGRHSCVFNITGDVVLVHVRWAYSKIEGDCRVYNFRLEKANEALKYESYSGELFEHYFSADKKERYGGYVDYAAGQTVVNTGWIDLSNYTSSSYWDYNDSSETFVSKFSLHNVGEEYSSWLSDMMCSHYRCAGSDRGAYNKSIAVSSSSGRIYIKDIDYDESTINNFAASLDGVELVYPVEEPFILSNYSPNIRTMSDPHNVWSDGDMLSMDYSLDLAEYIHDRIANVLGAPTTSLSGKSRYNFTDGADNVPMKSVQVSIKLVQEGSGDPSPTNIRAITGWTGAKVTRCGKNQLFAGVTNQTRNGLTFTAVGNGSSFRVNGTVVNGNVALTIATGAKAPEKLKSGMVYTLSGGHWSGESVAYIQLVYIGDTTGGTISIVSSNTSQTYRPTEDATLTGIYIVFKNGKTFSNDLVHPQFEIGSSATSYEPYTSFAYDVDFPTTAGTVYGGMLDVKNGTLTVTHKMIDLGTLNWVYNNRGYFDGYTSTMRSDVLRPSSDNDRVGLTCSRYIEKTSASIYYDSTINNAIAINSVDGDVWVEDTAYTDAEVFKTAMSGVQLVYPLATPVAYTLTPTKIRTLLGENNIWTNDGCLLNIVYRKEA